CFGLKSHVETDTASTNPEWCQFDDISRCGSLDPYVIIFKSKSLPHGQRKSLMGSPQKSFHDNKIQAMKNGLKNLDCEVSEKNMVIFAVNGLDSRFGILAEIIHHREPLPHLKRLGDLYPVTKSSNLPVSFVSISSSTWHQRLDHPGDEVLRSFTSRRFIYCNKEKSSHVFHACQLGKHVKLHFHSSYSILTKCFDIIHSDLWTSPIIVDSLHKEFDMTDLEILNYFVGISAVRHPTCLFLSQKKYALQLLERAHMVNYNPSQTPVGTDSKLGSNDLSYAVQQICLYMHDPREPYFVALNRIMCYVQGTLELGLHLYASGTTSLVGYTDDDWAGCPSTHSAEAEYQGVANVIAETACLHNLLCELHSLLLTATLVYFDNVSAIYMSTKLVQHQRTKHIKIDIHFVCDMVKAGHVRVLHVPSYFQYADIFTKGLPSALFKDFRSSLSVCPPPA
nr:hypothetical protein [Tanacetum cinerariifolium]